MKPHALDDPDRLTVGCNACVERAEEHRWANAPLREVDIAGVGTTALRVPADATFGEAVRQYWPDLKIEALGGVVADDYPAIEQPALFGGGL